MLSLIIFAYAASPAAAFHYFFAIACLSPRAFTPFAIQRCRTPPVAAPLRHFAAADATMLPPAFIERRHCCPHISMRFHYRRAMPARYFTPRAPARCRRCRFRRMPLSHY